MLKTNLTGVIYSISVSNLLFETIWITIRVDDRKQPSSLTFYKFQNTEFEKKKVVKNLEIASTLNWMSPSVTFTVNIPLTLIYSFLFWLEIGVRLSYIGKGSW